MATTETLPKSHRRIMAGIDKRHAKLEELLGRKLPPLPHPDDPPKPLKKIMADIAKRHAQIENLKSNYSKCRRTTNNIFPTSHTADVSDKTLRRHDKLLALIHKLREENRRLLDSITHQQNPQNAETN